MLFKLSKNAPAFTAGIHSKRSSHVFYITGRTKGPAQRKHIRAAKSAFQGNVTAHGKPVAENSDKRSGY
jgi:acid phosphatase class B